MNKCLYIIMYTPGNANSRRSAFRPYVRPTGQATSQTNQVSETTFSNYVPPTSRNSLYTYPSEGGSTIITNSSPLNRAQRYNQNRNLRQRMNNLYFEQLERRIMRAQPPPSTNNLIEWIRLRYPPR